jgi:hypothetical protein
LSDQFFFCIRADCAVAGGVAHAEQGVTLAHLLIIEIRLILLIHAAHQELAGARAAGSSPAGVREVNALLFSGIEDVRIVSAAEGFAAFERDCEGGHDDPEFRS